MSRRLSGEATWLIECRVNLSEIERRSKRHPKGNCLYKHPGIFIRMTVTHKDQSSLSRVVPSSLAQTRAHPRKLFLFPPLSLSLSLSLSLLFPLHLSVRLSFSLDREHPHGRATSDRARRGNVLECVLSGKEHTLASHVRTEIMSSKESIVS